MIGFGGVVLLSLTDRDEPEGHPKHRRARRAKFVADRDVKTGPASLREPFVVCAGVRRVWRLRRSGWTMSDRRDRRDLEFEFNEDVLTQTGEPFALLLQTCAGGLFGRVA